MSLDDPIRTAGATEPLTRALGKQVPFEGDDGLFTQSWFPICLSSAATRDFVRGFDFLDGRVMVFRGEDNKAQVMSAYCPHMGADLSVGDMIDGSVRCVFHHWKFNASGRCSGMPSKDPIPPTARLFTFPTCERYGIVWAYNGTEPHYALADFPYPEDELVFKTQVFGFELPVDPWIVTANTPDMQHIRYLHGIEINGDNPHDAVEWTDHSMYFNFTGTHVTGEPVTHRIGIVGTSQYYQHSQFAERTWFGFTSGHSLNRPGRSHVFMSVCVRKDLGTAEEIEQALNDVMELETRVVLDDLRNMQTIHFKPGTLTRSDLTLSRFFDYMRAFPRAHPSADFIN